ncbi:MAG: AlpA family phage regulatory protein [Bdellovibrionota bacterium]
MTSQKFLRIQKIIEITGLSESTIQRLEKKKLFPAKRKIGVRAVGWVETEVIDWVSQRSLVNKVVSNGI